jgi:hypothetical protein
MVYGLPGVHGGCRERLVAEYPASAKGRHPSLSAEPRSLWGLEIGCRQRCLRPQLP